MTEKIISTISKIYAKSLIDVAMESNSLDKFHQQFGEVLSVLKSSCDLQKVIGNPTIKNEDKVSVLDEIFSSRVDFKILNLLKLLIEKNRFDELESIYYAYCEMFDKNLNKKSVEVVSAVKLSFEDKTNILFKLEHKLNCEITPSWSVDENIIAGLLFKFDDYVIDTSVRTKIESLSKSISR